MNFLRYIFNPLYLCATPLLVIQTSGGLPPGVDERVTDAADVRLTDGGDIRVIE